jgi:hypothetical protein
MFKRIAESIKSTFRQETLAERGKRIKPGAIYGILAATVFVLVSAMINTVFFPDLHLGIDWGDLLTRWIEFDIAVAVAGAIVGWFTEDYMGVVWGGVVLTVLLLVGNLIASLVSSSATLTALSIVTALPLVGAGILLAGGIRMAVNRHLHIQQQESTVIRKKQSWQLIGIIILVGLIPGIFSRFGSSSVYAIRSINESLQKVAADPYYEYRFPLDEVPALKDHFGMSYKLYARTSTSEAGSMDISIRFQDGYTVTCLVPTDSGSATFLHDCNEGTKLIAP